MSKVIDITVNEHEWRRLMHEHGRFDDSIPITVQVERAVTKIVADAFERMGMPQEHLRTRGR